MPSVFCARRPFVDHHWGNVYSNPLPLFALGPAIFLKPVSVSHRGQQCCRTGSWWSEFDLREAGILSRCRMLEDSGVGPLGGREERTGVLSGVSAGRWGAEPPHCRRWEHSMGGHSPDERE